MRGWLNWRELEKLTVWGRKPRTEAERRRWDGMAAYWAQRSRNDGDAAERQVALMDLSSEDTVIDVCCGTGPLVGPVARRVKHLTCLDSSPAMLAYAREEARRAGVRNVSFIEGDFFTLEPGVDYPVHDVAIARYAPAQSDVLRLSRCARRQCYSISNCAPADGSEHPIVAIRALAPQLMPKGRQDEPNGRLFGYNIHFNLLYDHGANPTLAYAMTHNRRTAATLDELCCSLFRGDPTEDQMQRIRAAVEPLVTEEPDGSVCWQFDHKVAVLGWDPREL